MRIFMRAAVVACAGCGLAAADVIVSDGEFAEGTWGADEYPDPNYSTSAGSRIGSGGNPGAAWEVGLAESAIGRINSIVSRELLASYQFGIDGGIPIALRYRIDSLARSAIDPYRQLLRFLVTEDGVDYISSASVTVAESEWITRNSGFLTIDDFERLDGGPGLPQFEGLLRFGFVTTLDWTTAVPVALATAGYDNFRLELFVPGAGTLGAMAAGGLVVTRRRR